MQMAPHSVGYSSPPSSTRLALCAAQASEPHRAASVRGGTPGRLPESGTPHRSWPGPLMHGADGSTNMWDRSSATKCTWLALPASWASKPRRTADARGGGYPQARVPAVHVVPSTRAGGVPVKGLYGTPALQLLLMRGSPAGPWCCAAAAPPPGRLLGTGPRAGRGQAVARQTKPVKSTWDGMRCQGRVCGKGEVRARADSPPPPGRHDSVKAALARCHLLTRLSSSRPDLCRPVRSPGSFPALLHSAPGRARRH